MSAKLWLDHYAQQFDWDVTESERPNGHPVTYYNRGNVEIRAEFDSRGGLLWVGRYVFSGLDESFDQQDGGKREIAMCWLSSSFY
ncbi:hypothetical protein [Nocardia niwae]|uniref:hypothetical protein n=1 Tax=Nocardia niwae TaxID=626084 RepID=UPI0007A41C82|nr:hypothetical protein [Nocardia niwae]